MRTLRWLTATVLPLALLSFAAQSASAVVIDDFANPDPAVTFGNGDANPFNQGPSAANIGSRTLMVEDTGGGGTFDVNVSGQIGEGILAVNSSLAEVETTLDYTGLGGLDITGGLVFMFENVDEGTGTGVSIDVTVTDGVGTSTFSGSIPDAQAQDSTFTILGGQFAGTADLTAITGITVLFNDDEEANVDFQLVNLSTPDREIPEPASLAIWGMLAGGFGMMAARRRRKKAIQDHGSE